MAPVYSPRAGSLRDERAARHKGTATMLILLALAGGTLACGGSVGPRGREAAARPSQDHVESTLRNWYESLAEASTQRDAVTPLLRTHDLAFRPESGDERSEAAIESWIMELRSDLPQVAFALSKTHIDEGPDGSYRAHFELDRRGFDREGNEHVMRREQSWRFRQAAGGTLYVLAIEEKPLLVFPGSGPQIVCY
jgi:hypothetical protein